MDVEEDTSQSSYDSEDSVGIELENNILDQNVNCLFCGNKFNNVPLAIIHCQTVHEFDIYTLRDKFKLDYYGYIKLINYIRLEKPSAAVVMGKAVADWEDEKFLKPTDINDAWLWHDMEGLHEKSEEENFGKYVNISENGNVTMSVQHFQELQENILQLTEEIKKKDELIERFKEIKGELDKELPLLPSASNLNEEEDSQYFLSYSSPSIHWEMLKDTVRTQAYQNAIYSNRTLFAGKTVLDVGSGTGILSLMAASAGALKVVAVEESDVYYHALDIVRANNLEKTIHMVKGKLEQIKLPVPDKLDIIISEWMGYFLIFEGMIDSLIYARDKYLKPNGLILPSKCELKIVGASDLELYRNSVTFWDNVYGFNMEMFKYHFLKEGVVESSSPETIVTEPFTILELDTKTITVQDTIFKRNFSLICKDNCQLTHIVGYFDVFFDLEVPSSFTTGPLGQSTHWKQTSFVLKNTLPFKKGEIINGVISVTRHAKHIRNLVISLKIQEEDTQTYYLS